jgi:hypothetical protein
MSARPGVVVPRGGGLARSDSPVGIWARLSSRPAHARNRNERLSCYDLFYGDSPPSGHHGTMIAGMPRPCPPMRDHAPGERRAAMIGTAGPHREGRPTGTGTPTGTGRPTGAGRPTDRNREADRDRQGDRDWEADRGRQAQPAQAHRACESHRARRSHWARGSHGHAVPTEHAAAARAARPRNGQRWAAALGAVQAYLAGSPCR